MAFNPQKALKEYGRKFNSTGKSVFDHPKIVEWMGVWIHERQSGYLGWPDILELIHRGCEAEEIPFPKRGEITARALALWAGSRSWATQ